ncbi:MAG: response regulator [Casimicrobiaceae bacterium]
MRVLLIDDHALVRMGIAGLLRSRGVEVVAASSGDEGVRLALESVPDIVLLDMKMPGMNGIQTMHSLRARGVGVPVLMLTMSSEDADLSAALRAGAQGYLLKDMEPEDLVPALQSALQGESVVAKELLGTLARIVRGETAGRTEAPRQSAPFAELTARELEILEHVAYGSSNKVIANTLDITEGTVKLHVKAILRKLAVHSRVEAAVIAVEHGLGRKKRST